MKTTISRIIFCTAMLSLLAPMQLHAQGTDAEKQAIVDRINGFRATEGLPALSMWHDGGCVDKQAQQDSQGGGAHRTFGTCGERAQNTSPGWPSVAAVTSTSLQQMWDEKNGRSNTTIHYENMKGPYNEVAVGIHHYKDRNGKDVVWVNQNFR